MILIDVTQTSHTHAQTGVQRVCRGIYFALKRHKSVDTQPILWDPYLSQWRALFDDELATLEQRSSHSGKWKRRGAQWLIRQKLRSALFANHLQATASMRRFWDEASALIVPEIFSTKTHRAYRIAQKRLQQKGALCAIFHDSMAIDHPEHTDPKNVKAFDQYLKALNESFDFIAPNSSFSKESLLQNLNRLGLSIKPKIEAITLGVDPLRLKDRQGEGISAISEKTILSVGTIEGRKNHKALLDASEALWKQGAVFKLIIAGGANQRTGAAALQQIHELKESGRPIEYKGSVSEKVLQDCYRQADFTVYPSICEGFGLPIIEGIQYGKPCITGMGGALKETGEGGGVVCLKSVDPTSLSNAMRKMLLDEAFYAKLSQEASNRTVKTWDDYAEELLKAL